MRIYNVGVGYEGCVFETHIIQAKNQVEAYYAGVRLCGTTKGYNYINVKAAKK